MPLLFYTRTAVFSVYFLIVAILGVLICLCRPFNSNNNRLMARIFSWGGLRILGIDVQVEHPERLYALEPGVILANHQSNLDLFILGGLVPLRTASIGKSSLKWVPFFGQLYWLAGNVLIDRKDSKQSIGAMDQVSEAIVKDRRSIWIFPEGTRSLGKGLGQFKKGAFHIAVQAQCKITLVVASSYANRLDFGKWKAGKVVVSILPPLLTEGLQQEDVDDLLHSVHKQMADEIARLDARNKPPVDE